MNIVKLITSLQQAASAATTAVEYATLSKAIEKLNVGKVSTVSLISDLPTNLTTDGNLYFVTSEADLYYNVGPVWRLIYNIPTVVYGTGLNQDGRIGDNTIVSRSSPVTVVGGINNWSQISGGSRHSLGISTTGIAYAWGFNTFNRLGDGTLNNRSSPVTVVGGITTWTQISAGGYHSLGITSAGVAYAWGRNQAGQLGDISIGTKSSPVTVAGGITNWSRIATGRSHSLGLTSTGITYAWGYNTNGELGDNTTVNKSSPVIVVGGITNWSHVASGIKHNLGLTSTGIAYAWGLNQYGRLGDNDTLNKSSPVTVVGGINNWIQFSASYLHSLGRTSAGIAYAWGQNNNGQLGDNTVFANKSSPVTVVGGITNWSQLSAGGGGNSLALRSTGIAYAWGRGSYGRNGDNTNSDRSSPVTVVGGITTWTQISAGDAHNILMSIAV